MSWPGIRVMIHGLTGGTEHGASEYYGRTVTVASLKDNVFRLSFSDGKTIELTDEGQSCCESRYITTDDTPADLVGKMLRAVEVKGGPDEPAEYGHHDTAFVEISAGDTTVTLVTHVEHNGYYGGFALNIREAA